MRILVIGATGTIGKAVVAALSPKHDVVAASHPHATEKVDISDPASIRALLARLGKFDAIVSAAGSARFVPLASLSEDDFAYSTANKLMGQVNLTRLGMASLRRASKDRRMAVSSSSHRRRSDTDGSF